MFTQPMVEIGSESDNLVGFDIIDEWHPVEEAVECGHHFDRVE